MALPTNSRLPEFAKFTGQDSTSIIEHVSQYLTELGEASIEEVHRVCFFSLSLSGPAFTWFSSLAVNSISNWSDLKKKFHTYLYTRIGERKITVGVRPPVSSRQDMGHTIRGAPAHKIKACTALLGVHRKTLYSTK